MFCIGRWNLQQGYIHEYDTCYRNDYTYGLNSHRLLLYKKLHSQAEIKFFRALPDCIQIVKHYVVTIITFAAWESLWIKTINKAFRKNKTKNIQPPHNKIK